MMNLSLVWVLDQRRARTIDFTPSDVRMLVKGRQHGFASAARVTRESIDGGVRTRQQS